MFNAKLIYENGSEILKKADCKKCRDKITVTLKKEDVGEGVKYVDVLSDMFSASAGGEGYMVIPTINGTYLCKYGEKKDVSYLSEVNIMPVFGVKKENEAFIAVGVKMQYDFRCGVAVKDGKYFAFARFMLDGDAPYEDIELEIYMLPVSATYADMAKRYRRYQLERGACVPLKERVKNNGRLKYGAESVLVRIRQAWKEVPAKVLVQTEENEPPVKAMCTFDRVGDIVDALKKCGVDKAEISLVGWNMKGHDGRWPQTFPVEESLGGEEKLRKLIKKADDNGYNVTCHTNSTAMYNIADTYSDDDVVKDKNGGKVVKAEYWSGGRSYHLCPKVSYEKYAKNILPKVADIGFKGIHYIDVMSIVNPGKCYDKNHPLNTKEYADYHKKIMKLSKELMGGFSSEGPCDFTSENLDFALYSHIGLFGKMPEIFDKTVPFWQIVYHGIILYNPATECVNYPLKDEMTHLKFIEYGGRPAAYIYSKFVENENENWMGTDDLTCATDKELENAAGKIKKMYEEYKNICALQYEFIENHKEIIDNVFEVTYSDGSKITVDYNKLCYKTELK